MKLEAGEHRPLFLFAGPSTIRMTRLKKDAPIDRKLYLEAYQTEGIDMVKQMGPTAVYLIYSWGWEPEIEKEDWHVFEAALKLCHERGIEVFAPIMLNCIIYDGWFKKCPESMSWMARDRNGSMFPYPMTRQRAFCCLNNEDWAGVLEKLIRQVLVLGPDGIFLDNIGQKECYCSWCQRGYRDFLEEEDMAPVDLYDIKRDLKDPYYRAYCRFRCQTLVKFFARAREVIGEVNQGVTLVSNTSEITEINSIVEQGLNPSTVAKYQDSWWIEGFTFPHIDEGVIVNNCMSYKVARALGDGKPVSTMPYIFGAKEKPSSELGNISTIYTPREFKLQIAEASSQNAATTIKGNDYYDKYWTLITDKRFKEQRNAIRGYHQFLEEHKKLYQKAEYISNIGLLYSQNSMAWTRDDSFASFCGFFQTLYQKHIPFEIATEEQLEKGKIGGKHLLIMPSVPCFGENSLKTLYNFLERGGKLIISGKFATYNLRGDPIHYELAVRLLDHNNTTYYKDCPGCTVEKNKLFNLNVANFLLPYRSDEIVNKIKKLVKLPFEIKAERDKGVTIWKKDNNYIVHVVNYSEDRKKVDILFSRRIKTFQAFSCDSPANTRVESKDNLLRIRDTDIYDLVVVKLNRKIRGR